MVVICIWCALFVTPQFDVIFMFSNQILAKFVDTIGMFFYTHSPYFCKKIKPYALP